MTGGVFLCLSISQFFPDWLSFQRAFSPSGHTGVTVTHTCSSVINVCVYENQTPACSTEQLLVTSWIFSLYRCFPAQRDSEWMCYLLWRLSLDVLYAGLELRLGEDCWLLYSDLWPPEFPVWLRFGCLGLILFVFVNCWTAAEKTQWSCERRLNMMISCLNMEINAFKHFTRDGHVTKTSTSFVCLFIQFYV